MNEPQVIVRIRTKNDRRFGCLENLKTYAVFEYQSLVQPFYRKQKKVNSQISQLKEKKTCYSNFM